MQFFPQELHNFRESGNQSLTDHCFSFGKKNNVVLLTHLSLLGFCLNSALASNVVKEGRRKKVSLISSVSTVTQDTKLLLNVIKSLFMVFVIGFSSL